MLNKIFSAVAVIAIAFISSASSRSITMMASKYLGKSPVFVAGGSNGVGFEIVKQLTQLGTPVHALVRREVIFAAIRRGNKPP
jgi:NADP-dependent 3-hydroxy acid dehydrogenase YdfG